MASGQTLQVRVKSIGYEADGIHSLDLRPLPPDRALPGFTAGSHVDLHLTNGLIRSYSLLNAPHEVHRYVVAVNKDTNTRGGSRFIHENIRPGDTLTISEPRNNFPLVEDAVMSVFIAGGIGITPIWSMIQRLEALGAPWLLHYATRSRKCTALLDELLALPGAPTRVHLQFDAESGGRLLDLPRIVSQAPKGAHLYCCGPVPMLEAFEKATDSRPSGNVHVEYFATKDKASTGGGFSVRLAKSGKTIQVCPGKTILDALLDEGIRVPYSCQEGICGSCEVGLLAGKADHRDLVLSPQEKAENKSILVCCSGSESPELVLDL